MDFIEEPAKRVPVAEDVDICVVGGSCTGVFAALAAARLGADVAIIENNNCFGGVATAGLVSIWHSLMDNVGEKQIIAGMTEEVLCRLEKRNAVRKGTNPNSAWYMNTEELKIELDEMVIDAGIRPFLHTKFVAADADECGHINAVIVEDKSGRRAVRAKQFIDATGDGDVVDRLGLSYRLANPFQPPTTCFFIHGLDEIVKQYPDFSLIRAVHNPEFRNHLENGFLWSAEVVGAPEMRMVAGSRVHNANCSDADELTRAEIEARRQVRIMCDILRENFKGGEHVSVQNLASYIGIRETRHADCLHTLTEEEVLTGKRFDDAIANGTYHVDIHHSEKPGLTFKELNGTQSYVAPGQDPVHSRWRPEQTENPTFYQVPYRSLVPKNSDNLLVAGRCIDTDKGAFGATRVMVNTNQTGQAAGVAAYLALQSKGRTAGVDPCEVRRVLGLQGAVVI